jgi:KTSC domain-containing protein
MEMRPVSSGGVRGEGYDAATEALRVQMADGTLYEFMEVPPDVYGLFSTSASKDAFVEGTLKANYRYVALN